MTVQRRKRASTKKPSVSMRIGKWLSAAPSDFGPAGSTEVTEMHCEERKFHLCLEPKGDRVRFVIGRGKWYKIEEADGIGNQFVRISGLTWWICKEAVLAYIGRKRLPERIRIKVEWGGEKYDD